MQIVRYNKYLRIYKDTFEWRYLEMIAHQIENQCIEPHRKNYVVFWTFHSVNEEIQTKKIEYYKHIVLNFPALNFLVHNLVFFDKFKHLSKNQFSVHNLYQVSYDDLQSVVSHLYLRYHYHKCYSSTWAGSKRHQ